MEKKPSKRFFDQVIQELYYRDLRQLSGIDKDEEALLHVIAYQRKTARHGRPLLALWQKIEERML